MDKSPTLANTAMEVPTRELEWTWKYSSPRVLAIASIQSVFVALKKFYLMLLEHSWVLITYKSWETSGFRRVSKSSSNFPFIFQVRQNIHSFFDLKGFWGRFLFQCKLGSSHFSLASSGSELSKFPTSVLSSKLYLKSLCWLGKETDSSSSVSCSTSEW